MTAFVVDTNVLVVANGKTEQASPDCIRECVNALERIQKKGRLVLDDAMLIFQEYRPYGSFSGQPGVGHAFFKWAHNNRYNDHRCELVTLHPRGTTGQDFEEFPDDPDLKGFGPDDRKFVAVARASKHAPRILNAVDSDWWDYREPLKRHGVKIVFLCPEQFEED